MLVFGWTGLSFLLVCLLGASELVRAVVHGISALTVGPLSPARRVFLSRGIAGTAILVALGLGGIGVANAFGQVAVRRVRVVLRRLPRACRDTASSN